MKANQCKCHLLLSTSKPSSIRTDRYLIISLQFKKPSGVQYDNKSKFDTYIKIANFSLHLVPKIYVILKASKLFIHY